MNAGVSGARFAAATKELLARWKQTREVWTDEKAREFENRFITPLEAAVNSAVSGISELDLILQKIKSDCE